MERIGLWDFLEIELRGEADGNPYDGGNVWAEFVHAEDSVRIEGFYDGGGVYKVRFMPTQLGAWRYTVHSNLPGSSDLTGEVECVAPRPGAHGPVRAEGMRLVHQDGTRHFSIGTTCYAWIYQDAETIEKTFASLDSTGFTKMRMCVFPKYYVYNLKEPSVFPYVRKSDGTFDYAQFDPAFFHHLDGILLRLRDMGIEADLILFHPYDKNSWGFMSMGREADARYLRYMTARYAAYSNVWWSMANEFDLFQVTFKNPEAPDTHGAAIDKEMEDWDRFFHIVQAHDPYQHLRSIHNCRTMYDHGKPWVTHCSVQRVDTVRTAEYVTDWREQYQKPIVYDECAYEGDIPHGWGNISGQEMTRRFWEGVLRGGHMGHGETFVGHDDVLWWSHGGDLHGESPKRIRFLKTILEQTPNGKPVDPLPCSWDDVCGGIDDTYKIYYYGFFRPTSRTFVAPEGITYRAEVIDTWNMTVTPVEGTYSGRFTIPLPGREYMAIRLVAAHVARDIV